MGTRAQGSIGATLVVASVSNSRCLPSSAPTLGQRRADSATASALITPTTWQDEALRYTRSTHG